MWRADFWVWRWTWKALGIAKRKSSYNQIWKLNSSKTTTQHVRSTNLDGYNKSISWLLVFLQWCKSGKGTFKKTSWKHDVMNRYRLCCTYLLLPFKHAFCMASTVYWRNSWASSWFPKRKCLAIPVRFEERQALLLHTLCHGDIPKRYTWNYVPGKIPEWPIFLRLSLMDLRQASNTALTEDDLELLMLLP